MVCLHKIRNMETKPLGTLFTEFLFIAEKNGYSLSDVNHHLIQFGLPIVVEPILKYQKVDNSNPQPEAGRDFSRYAFGDRIQNKRRTMLTVIKHLIAQGISVIEINKIGSELRSSRSWLKPTNEVVGDLERRYFLKPGETIAEDGNDYAVLSQWGGSRFKEAVHILNKKYNLDIQQIS